MTAATESDLADGETGVVLDEVGLEVEVTENSAPALGSHEIRGAAIENVRSALAGTLYATRYDDGTADVTGAFEGEATAPDGSSVTPNKISATRHWLLQADGPWRRLHIQRLPGSRGS